MKLTERLLEEIDALEEAEKSPEALQDYIDDFDAKDMKSLIKMARNEIIKSQQKEVVKSGQSENYPTAS